MTSFLVGHLKNTANDTVWPFRTIMIVDVGRCSRTKILNGKEPPYAELEMQKDSIDRLGGCIAAPFFRSSI